MNAPDEKLMFRRTGRDGVSFVQIHIRIVGEQVEEFEAMCREYRLRPTAMANHLIHDAILAERAAAGGEA